MKKTVVTLAGALVAVGTSVYMLSESGEGLRISGYKTNFLEVIHVNPAWRTTNSVMFVRGDGIFVTTNAGDWEKQVFCTNAFVLNWHGESDKCYDVEWTTNFIEWTHSMVWRVGENTNITFLTPVDWPMCVFRLRQMDCESITNRPPIPPPPPMPPVPKSGYAQL